MKHKLTKADLKKRLSDFGFKEGDEIILPSEKAKTNESTSTNEGGESEGGEDDGEGGNGGGNNPGQKPPFKKP
jgi:hypothetical protein